MGEEIIPLYIRSHVIAKHVQEWGRSWCSSAYQIAPMSSYVQLRHFRDALEGDAQLLLQKIFRLAAPETGA